MRNCPPPVMEGRMELRDEAPPVEDAGGGEMRAPEEVAVMLHLHALGWGAKRIAAELGGSRNTARRYLRQGGWAPPRAPERRGALDGLGAWLGGRVRGPPRRGRGGRQG